MLYRNGHSFTWQVKVKNGIANLEGNLAICDKITFTLFTTGNRVTSIFRSNQIKESVPETPEPSQKTHPLNVVPLRLLSVPKPVSARVI